MVICNDRKERTKSLRQERNPVWEERSAELLLFLLSSFCSVFFLLPRASFNLWKRYDTHRLDLGIVYERDTVSLRLLHENRDGGEKDEVLGELRMTVEDLLDRRSSRPIILRNSTGRVQFSFQYAHADTCVWYRAV